MTDYEGTAFSATGDIRKDVLNITAVHPLRRDALDTLLNGNKADWQSSLKKSRFGQYLLGSFLGAIPGCLGAFTVVSLYSHRVLGLGALVATMISGLIMQ